MSDMVITKRCSHCKQLKNITDFYKSKNCKDGHTNQCKICQLTYFKSEKGKIAHRRAIDAYQDRNRERIIKYGREYRASDHGKFVAKKYRQNTKNRSRKRSPEKTAAQNALNHAIKVGKIPHISTQICTRCGKQAKNYHHVLGYAPKHWLDVMPVCAICHRSIHSIIK
jgi:hypothetical protein